jgi:nuclear protein localization family protein 4
MHVATAPNLDDPTVLDSLLVTESWQTLMTFARESARTLLQLRSLSVLTNFDIYPIAAPQRPTQPAPDGPPARFLDEDKDIPPELFDEIATPTRGGSDNGGTSGGRVCPHCTFENTHSGNDCDVCGLPL